MVILASCKIDPRAHDCYGLVCFTPTCKTKTKEPAHDKIKHLSIRDRDQHRYIHGSISLTNHSNLRCER